MILCDDERPTMMTMALVKGIKDIEKSFGSDGPRIMTETENEKRGTLSHK